MATGAIDADALAADAVDEIWDEVMEGSTTARQSVRLANSANGAKVAGAATTNVTIRDLADWQNHQYDPGYLSNLGRLRLLSGGRRGAARYLLPILGTFLVAILVLPALAWAGLASPLVLLLVGLALVALLVVALAQPLRAPGRRSGHRTGRNR